MMLTVMMQMGRGFCCCVKEKTCTQCRSAGFGCRVTDGAPVASFVRDAVKPGKGGCSWCRC